MTSSKFLYTVIPPYIYTSREQTEKSSLELIIANSSDSPILFENAEEKSPDDYPDYDDPKNKSDPAGFYIYFDYGDKSGDLTTDANKISISLRSLSPGWNVSSARDSASKSLYWVIAPDKTTDLATRDSISLKIDGIKCNNAVGKTPIYIEYRTDGEAVSEKEHIYKFEKLNYDLLYKTSTQYITADETNAFDFYITNNALSSLNFANTDSLNPEQYPEYEDFSNPKNAAGFYLYFNYGENGGDITTKENSVNIYVSIKNKSNWKIFQAPSPTVGQYWRICPQGTTSLASHDCLVIHVENVKCNSELGVTPIYVELRAQGKILSDRSTFVKLSKPIIKSFGPVKNSYNINENVMFVWKVVNADSCEIKINDTDVTNKEQAILKMMDKEYQLTVKNFAGYSDSKTFTPTFSFITSFNAVSCDGETVTLKWETQNGSSCEIEGVGEVPLNGSKAVSAARGTQDIFEFKLKLKQLDSYKIHEKTFTFGYPKITQFGLIGKLCGSLINTTLPLIEGKPFISLYEIESMATVPIITRPYDSSPRVWYEGIEWNANYAEYYELVDYGKYTCKGYNWIALPDPKVKHYTLRAYSLSDKIYDERSI